jgi:hypothetical protein
LVKRYRKAKAIKTNSLKILQEKFTAHAINEQDITFAINKQKELINSNNSKIISSIIIYISTLFIFLLSYKL